MQKIPLTQGQFALVDDSDYEFLSQWKWYAHKHSSGDFHAMRASPRKNGKEYSIYMSRQILGLKHGDKRQADHINHNTLDNRQSNIRICTNQQNSFNRKSISNTSSKFKGVSWYERCKKWQAHIQMDRKRKHLGLFRSEKKAALAYDFAAKSLYGEFACLNF